MKKVCIYCALMCATLFAFSQVKVSDEEITRIFKASKEINRQSAGVTNPDLIYPGQTLSYIFKDGTNEKITVVSGDTQRGIVAKILAEEKKHGPVQSPSVSVAAIHYPIEIVPTKNVGSNQWLIYLLIAAIISGLLYYLIKRYRDARRDPVTSGNPMRTGGITDAQAPAYANEVASRTFNQPNLNVTNVTKGTMSGTNVEVYYRGSAIPQRRTFSDVAAYRGQVTVENTPQFIYFLQGCGNDARIGNYFSGQNISFIPEEVLTAQPNSQPPAELSPILAEQPAPGGNADFTQMVKSITEAAATTGNAKVKMTGHGLTIEMEFSKAILATNTNHMQRADSEVTVL